MKKLAADILCSTGITLLLLACFATMYGAKFLFVSGVFQSFAANILVHSGLLLLHKIESKYVVLEIMLDIGYTIAVVLTCGTVFDWYSSTPIGVLVVMTILIYFCGVLLSVIRIRQDIKEINKLLHKRIENA